MLRTVLRGALGVMLVAGTLVIGSPAQAANPTAVDDQATTAPGDSVSIDVLANDTDGDGDTLEVADWTDPEEGGFVSCEPSGECLYDPIDDSSEYTDIFEYEANDNNGGSDIGQVTITVEAPPPPVHARTISLDLDGHLSASGQLDVVGGGATFCVDSQTVQIQKKRGTEFVTVQEVTTDASGAFTATLDDAKGTYRAVAAESQAGPGPDTCSAATSGTKKHLHKARKVTLALKRHLRATGRLTVVGGGSAMCVSQQPVKIQRKVRRRWKTVETARTNDNGSYNEAIPDKQGRYRAKVTEVSVGANDTLCGAALSDLARHSH